MGKTIDFPPTIRIGILVYEGFEPIDVWALPRPSQSRVSLAQIIQSPPPYPFEIKFISNELRPRGKTKAVPLPVKSSNGPRVLCGEIAQESSYTWPHAPGFMLTSAPRT
jgi:hypothetical protein